MLSQPVRKREAVSLFSQVKDSNGELHFNETDKRRVIFELCSNAYGQMPSDHKQGTKPFEPQTFSPLLGQITWEEVVEAVIQLNRGKSPGPDGPPAEFYLLGLNDVIDLLTSVFNTSLKNG